MSPELERQLCIEFPATFAALAKRPVDDQGNRIMDLSLTPIQGRGIEHGDGWYDILHRFAAQAEPWCRDTGSYISQCKEKFGILTIYFDSPDRADDAYEFERFGPMLSFAPRLTNDGLREHLEEARKESSQTCELCGQPGAMRQRHSIVRVRCEACLS